LHLLRPNGGMGGLEHRATAEIAGLHNADCNLTHCTNHVYSATYAMCNVLLMPVTSCCTALLHIHHARNTLDCALKGRPKPWICVCELA
jgi:hypothetical protein